MSDVVHIDRLELSFAPKDWPFANERRAEIDAHFAKEQARIPALFNGRVLVMHSHELSGGVFRGAYLETDFASFLAWRDWGYPDRSVCNCFAAAGLRGADGGFVLGVMSEDTANAGRVYFPAGTPDLNDVVGTGVDLRVSVTRELHEETGLSASEFEIDSGWYVVPHGPRFAMMKMMQSDESSARIRERILDNLGTQSEPEWSDVVIVRGPDDLDGRMMEYVAPFLHHIWRR